MTSAEIREIFELCQEFHVKSFDSGEITVVFEDRPVPVVVQEDVIDVKDVDSGKKGKDGLTRAEQIDAYGRAMDDLK